MARKLKCECGECRTCKHREYMREYYRRPGKADKARGWATRYRTANVEMVRAKDRARGHRNSPESTLAHNRARVLERQPCEVCGEKAEAHHPDYSKPLDVRWLCKRHHMIEHRKVA